MPDVPGKMQPRPNDSPADAGPGPRICSLCGLPASGTEILHTRGGELLHFCCPGCHYVFEILFNRPEGPPADYRNTELYRACVAAGLVPAGDGNTAPDGQETRPQPEGAARLPDPGDADRFTEELTLRIGGMWCSACSWLIEEIVRKTRGVLDCRVLFFSDLARIRYFPHLVRPAEIVSRISRLGYRAGPFEAEAVARDNRDLAIRLGVSAFLTMNVMMISFALYFGFFEDLGREGVHYLSYPIWVLATPVIFYGGYPILARGVAGLRHGHLSMETLISVGSLSAYGYSVIGVLSGSLHLYFDAAAMLVTLVLLGRFIENRAREKLTRGLAELCSLAHGKVRLEAGGRERWVSADQVEPGAEFVVRPEERVPLDARILAGGGLLDESILTGESRPNRKGPGDDVPAGALLLDGELRLEATRTGADGSLVQTISLVRDALTRKNPTEIIADRITRRVVPLIFLLSGATALWLVACNAPTEEALMRALTVLFITCPCALGIATPLAKVAAIGVGRASGILVGNPVCLEKGREIDAVVFDKTGTLTEGRFALQKAWCDGAAEDEALRFLAAVEARSNHFLAVEIVRRAAERGIEPGAVSAFEAVDGLGVRGRVEGVAVVAGNRRFMIEQGLEIPDAVDRAAREAEEAGDTAVFFGWGGRMRGSLVFGDRVKESSAAVVAELQGRGIETWLVSGDSNRTTAAVSRGLGIANCLGEVLPEGKGLVIERLREQGKRVAMVGDGINDAPALALADVGIALGVRANDLLHAASDVTLLSDDPGKALEFLRLSRLTTRVIRQNFLFAFVYNALGIPLAVAGALNPLVAVFAMFASSLTVIGNTMRISGGFRE